jgi:hypothetical protein
MSSGLIPGQREVIASGAIMLASPVVFLRRLNAEPAQRGEDWRDGLRITRFANRSLGSQPPACRC